MKYIAPLGIKTVWQSPSVAVLVLANLIPLAGVIFFGWEVFPIMLLFWLENVVVGAMNVLKMLCATADGGVMQIIKVIMIPFFCVHYGMFTMVHGVFVFALFGKELGVRPSFFPTPDLVWGQVRQLHLGWAMLALSLSHVFSFGWNYLRRGEYRRVEVPVLMMQPYGRVVVLHLSILGGGFLILALGSPVAALALLVLLKIGLDVVAHAKEHSLGKVNAGNNSIENASVG